MKYTIKDDLLEIIAETMNDALIIGRMEALEKVEIVGMDFSDPDIIVVEINLEDLIETFAGLKR